MPNLRSRNDYKLAEEIEYNYLRELSPAQTMREFLSLFDEFRHQLQDTGELLDDEHRAGLIELQERLAKSADKNPVLQPSALTQSSRDL